ncbi:MAG: hypothetical protein Q9208_004973 [Pyrenodesmia sp. 3 TL-2023]
MLAPLIYSATLIVTGILAYLARGPICQTITQGIEHDFISVALTWSNPFTKKSILHYADSFVALQADKIIPVFIPSATSIGRPYVVEKGYYFANLTTENLTDPIGSTNLNGSATQDNVIIPASWYGILTVIFVILFAVAFFAMSRRSHRTAATGIDFIVSQLLAITGGNDADPTQHLRLFLQNMQQQSLITDPCKLDLASHLDFIIRQCDEPYGTISPRTHALLTITSLTIQCNDSFKGQETAKANAQSLKHALGASDSRRDVLEREVEYLRPAVSRLEAALATRLDSDGTNETPLPHPDCHGSDDQSPDIVPIAGGSPTTPDVPEAACKTFGYDDSCKDPKESMCTSPAHKEAASKETGNNNPGHDPKASVAIPAAKPAAPKESGDEDTCIAHSSQLLTDEGLQSTPGSSHGGIILSEISEDSGGAECNVSGAGNDLPANVRPDGKQPIEELTGQQKRKVLYKIKKNKERMAREKEQRAAAKAQKTEDTEHITDPSSLNGHPDLATDSGDGDGAIENVDSRQEGENVGEKSEPQSPPNVNHHGPEKEPKPQSAPDANQYSPGKEPKPQSLPETDKENPGSAAARSYLGQQAPAGQGEFRQPAPPSHHGRGGQRNGGGYLEGRGGRWNGRGGQRAGGGGGHPGGRGGRWNGQRGRGGYAEGQWNSNRGRDFT